MIATLLFAAMLSSAQTSAIESAAHDAIFNRHIPSVVVRVDIDGKPAYEHAWGFRNVADKLEANIDTRYQYGSITKQFTGAAILLLAQENRLSLDDKLSKWLPGLPSSATIRQTLIHSSGVADFGNVDELMMDTGPLPFVGSERIVKYAQTHPANFQPGEKAEYDNTAYVLLARIVEAASHQGYEQYLRESFFKPLNMTSVHGYQSLAIEPNTALGYMWWDQTFAAAITQHVQPLEINTLYLATPWNIRQMDGAGFLVGDVADLQKWDNALAAGKIFNAKYRELFFTPGKLNNGELAFTSVENKMKSSGVYCYGGLGRFPIDGVTLYGANGGTRGFLTFTATIPTKHMSVTILSNLGMIDNSKLTTPILESLVR